MTDSIPPAQQLPRLQLRLALRTLRDLMAHPEHTEKASEFIYASGDRFFERMFQRFVAHPEGQRLLAQRPSLCETLADRSALQRMAEGSFGRAYLDYLDRAGLDTRGLMKASEEGLQGFSVQLDPHRAWFRDRYIAMHDLWHVLAGYGTDELGEAALLPFTYAQSGGRSWALFSLGAGLAAWRTAGEGWPRYLWTAWQRGRRAAWLPALPYEQLLSLPLAAVRRRAGLEAPEIAHPGGVLRGAYTLPSDGQIA